MIGPSIIVCHRTIGCDERSGHVSSPSLGLGANRAYTRGTFVVLSAGGCAHPRRSLAAYAEEHVPQLADGSEVRAATTKRESCREQPVHRNRVEGPVLLRSR